MTYTLLAIFVLSGNVYVERTGLSLQGCAARAAVARHDADVLAGVIGEVRYQCQPERPLARSSTDSHGIGQ